MRGSRPGQGGDAAFSAFGPSSAPSAAGPSAGPAGSTESAGPQSKGGSSAVKPAGRLSLRNRRVRVKLAAVVLIPSLLAVAFGGFQIYESYDQWTQARDAEKVAQLVLSATDVVNALENERTDTAVPLAAGKTNDKSVQAAYAATDAAMAKFDELAKTAPHTGHLYSRFADIKKAESAIQTIRKTAYSKPNSETELEYGDELRNWEGIDNELGLGAGANVTTAARSMYAITLGSDGVSFNIALVDHMLTENADPSDTDRATQAAQTYAFLYLENIAIQEFQGAADQHETDLYNQAVKQATAAGQAMLEKAAAQAKAAGKTFTPPPSVTDMETYLQQNLTNSELARQGVTIPNWNSQNQLSLDAMRQVEGEIGNEALNSATDLANSARNTGIAYTAIVLLALILAALVTSAISRSLVNGMRTLRDSAQQIASDRLPALVARLSAPVPGQVDTRVEPIPLNGADEVGEVARAFDQVHEQAVKLAAEQALLRGNVNSIFANLSQRTQGLIERQIALITDLENNEADPDQLESLFKLDHLATRMRRNGENLLVLAGEEPGRTWNQPIPLVDVLRAAAAEVEEYERVELSGIPETDIVGPAVTDLVHLLAELLENATTFSSPQTRVRVNATRLPDQRVLIEIHDKGIGLRPEDFTEINAKLNTPSGLDASVSRQMGLYVVGRLASRHGVRVQLRPSGEASGTTSLVMIPDRLTQTPGQTQPEEEFTVSRIVGDSAPASWSEAPTRTADELGFDESRWNTGRNEEEQPAGALDSVRRSLDIDRRRRAHAGELDGQPQARELEAGSSAGQQNGQQNGQQAGDNAQAAQAGWHNGQNSGPYTGQGDTQSFALPGGGVEPGAWLPQQQTQQQSGYQSADYPAPYGGHSAETNWGAPLDSGYQDQRGGYQDQQQSGYPGSGARYPEPASAQGAQGSHGTQGSQGGYDPAASLREQYATEFRSGGPIAPQVPEPQAQQPQAQQSQAPQYGREAAQEQAPAGYYGDQDQGSRSGGSHGPADTASSAGSNGSLPQRRPGRSIDSGQGIASSSLRGEQERPAFGGGSASPASSRSTGTAAASPSGSGSNWFTPGSTAAKKSPAEPARQEGAWQSPSDSTWRQASSLQRPATSGTTASGLPMRQPRQNLVAGNAPTAESYSGPQVARTPDEVRGRLSSLRRGVEQGRAGGQQGSPESPSASPDQPGGAEHFGGPHHQER